MSFEEAEIIKRRAEAFLRNSEDLIGKKEWDLAVFSLEQYCQLILKYKMLVHFGTYPRTHSIRRLIKDLTKINTKLRSFIEDEDKLHYIARLEEAYVASRYFPYTYEEKETISLFKFVKEVFKPIIDEL
ncbi:HEPN domain-containing protein [Fervidicoccus fontis]|nr:HEPN domain-containing protein [Fervidicoccus fontis]MBE9390926.1 HEPN domain-containing protein [Fervidicoccus fontis]PMB76004.1 MAG: DNA-binding protein [Fervidicoccus fontis]PMB77128.1 MAG: DNA-binding protein [Fervidicoccus fontis]HEW64327.1 HEPN domain-containing protein [Fervidicoccus fontis]